MLGGNTVVRCHCRGLGALDKGTPGGRGSCGLKRSGRGRSAGTRSWDGLGGGAFGALSAITTRCGTQPDDFRIFGGESGGGAFGALSAITTRGGPQPDDFRIGGGESGGVASPASGTFVDSPSSNGSPRFCGAAVTSLVTFASWSGLFCIAAGAASAKLMMKSIRRV